MVSENYHILQLSPLYFLIDVLEAHMFPRFRSLQGKAMSWQTFLKSNFTPGENLFTPPITFILSHSSLEFLKHSKAPY